MILPRLSRQNGICSRLSSPSTHAATCCSRNGAVGCASNPVSNRSSPLFIPFDFPAFLTTCLLRLCQHLNFQDNLADASPAYCRGCLRRSARRVSGGIVNRRHLLITIVAHKKSANPLLRPGSRSIVSVGLLQTTEALHHSPPECFSAYPGAAGTSESQDLRWQRLPRHHRTPPPVGNRSPM